MAKLDIWPCSGTSTLREGTSGVITINTIPNSYYNDGTTCSGEDVQQTCHHVRHVLDVFMHNPD